ncbi:MAG: hypothetical protein DBX52_04930 [Clostridiales bacterium]|nr:MAG: hypothetical protein DBX52_04930 [Clostridiales bacterium]
MQFQLQTTDGPRSYPNDFQERWTLLFYYSGDFLPVTATELMGLSTLQHDFYSNHCDILCISTDSIPVHLAFLETLSHYRIEEQEPVPIAFPLASDETGALRDALQLSSDQKYIWLLAPGGAPKAHFSYLHQTGANFTEVLRTLLALQTGKPTPYGWVPGAHALLPPPVTRGESIHHMNHSEKAGHYCIDWYLCFDASDAED